MVWFQYYTGARPGEVCRLRPIDITTQGKVWTYKPPKHKTQHHGKSRTILIGPIAQQVIQPFLSRDLHAFLFSPAEAWTQRHDQKTEGKQYAKWASYQKRREQRIGRGGSCYSVNPTGEVRIEREALPRTQVLLNKLKKQNALPEPGDPEQGWPQRVDPDEQVA